jgi:hypothetical protein
VRSPLPVWLDAAKTGPSQVKLIDKDIDRPDRSVLAQIDI